MHRRAFIALVAGAPLIPLLPAAPSLVQQARLPRQQAKIHNFQFFYGTGILFEQFWVSEPVVSHVFPRGAA